MDDVVTKRAEEARNQLPDLLDAAENGQVTIITRHGRPVAALIPIGAYKASATRQPPVTPLEGTGRGLWGKDSRKFIRKLRDELDRKVR